ncbi:hypothetical protein ACIRQP_21220 [Streptomyces sp. NPDC102274]|uniref:hypothetical protein n=1 Tax=Streptomyces sp. NPDC102274 TaxID=3366151 RepID=UPI0037F9277C
MAWLKDLLRSFMRPVPVDNVTSANPTRSMVPPRPAVHPNLDFELMPRLKNIGSAAKLYRPAAGEDDNWPRGVAGGGEPTLLTNFPVLTNLFVGRILEW